VPVAVVFLLRAVVLVLLWGFVIAAVVAVRHDVFNERARRITPPAPRPTPATAPVPVAKPDPKPSRAERRRARHKPDAAATRIVVVDGALTGLTVALSSLPVTIGRASDSTIVITDDYVSNHHARLVPQDGQWLLEDTGSTNGTFLGDTKLTAPVVVSIGSRIRIGNNVLELQA
jgi:pSer/pThr/pTyr-binding forkhead associated (FHA) protein